jgi:DNA invertase Pin-like site-specific DNA recombinase
MNQGELSKVMTAILGRKPRKDRGVPRSPTSRLLRQPSYKRVTAAEVERYRRLQRNGRSVRAIARRYGRSHATVRRWLAREVVGVGTKFSGGRGLAALGGVVDAVTFSKPA